MSGQILARLGSGTWQLRGHHIRFHRHSGAGHPGGWGVSAYTYHGRRDDATERWLNEMGLHADGQPVIFDALEKAVRATLAAVEINPLPTTTLAPVKLVRRGADYETEDGRWIVRRNPAGVARWRIRGPRHADAPTLAYARAKIASFQERERMQAQLLARARDSGTRT